MLVLPGSNSIVALAAEIAASTRIALALKHEVLQLLGLVVFARWLSGAGETAVARRLLQFVGDHPRTTANVRQQVDHAVARLAAAPAGERAPPRAGPGLDELSRRIVEEADDGFLALRLELGQA